jgi:hypothetical protein
MTQTNSNDSGSKPLSPQAKHLFDMLADYNREYLAQIKAPAPVPVPPPQSRLSYAPDDIIELAFAGNQLALFLVSSDMTECAVCMAQGSNMGQPENHNPLCKLARWWRAVDALRVGVEPTHVAISCRYCGQPIEHCSAEPASAYRHVRTRSFVCAGSKTLAFPVEVQP